MRSRVALVSLFLAVVTLALPIAAHAAQFPFLGPIIPDGAQRCPGGWGLLIQIINNIIAISITIAVVFVAPLMIAYAGFLFVVNPFNAEGMSKAKEILKNTIIGIVIALCSWAIVDAVMAVLYNGKFGSSWSAIVTWNGDICIKQRGTAEGDKLNQSANTAPGSNLLTTSGGASSKANAAADYLTNNAGTSSTGYCARSVRQALGAAGYTNFSKGVGSAYQFGDPLTKAGFSPIDSNGYTPSKGDVIVFQPVDGHPDGHVEMYNGTGWVSDFKQNSMLPSTDYSKGSYQVYRPPGGP
jgi:hypothetical protein